MNLDETAIANEVVETCHRLYQKGLVSSTGGNVSARCLDGLLITPTGHCLGTVRAEDLVKLTLTGEILSQGKPSKEWRFHSEILRKWPQINAVIHVHPTYTVAIASSNDLCFSDAMPTYTPGYAVKVGTLPVVPFMPPGSPELSAALMELIEGHNAVMMQNHGATSIAATLEGAYNIMEEIEENARLCIILGDKGRPLSQGELSQLYYRAKIAK